MKQKIKRNLKLSALIFSVVSLIVLFSNTDQHRTYRDRSR